MGIVLPLILFTRMGLFQRLSSWLNASRRVTKMANKILLFLVFVFPLFSFSSVFMNLRHEKTNFRYGPEMTFPLKFTWNGAGLPVEVIKEQGQWAYVQDSEGDLGWLQRRMLSKNKLALVLKDAELRTEKDPRSKLIAFPRQGALVRVKACENNVCYVQVSYQEKKIEGWILKRLLWGAA